MSRLISSMALVLAAVLAGTAGLIDFQRQNAARKDLVAETTVLARLRADDFGDTLAQLASRVDGFSSDGALTHYALARGHQQPSEDQRTKRALAEIERVAPHVRGSARIVDTRTRARLLRTATQLRLTPTPLFSRTLLVELARKSVRILRSESASGESTIVASAPVRMIDGTRTSYSIVLSVPLDQVLFHGLTGNLRPDREVLADNGNQVISIAPRHSSDDRSTYGEVARFFTSHEGDPRTAEIGGHMWGFYKLPQEIGGNGEDGYDWWFIAVRSRSPLPSFMRELGASGVVMLLVSMLLVLFGLIALRMRRRDLERSAGTDQLTGIPNRRAMLRDLEEVQDNRTSIRLAMYDLNGFKEYNDTFGHLAGDALLGRVATALRDSVAPGKAYRLGGDEFCVLSPVELADDIEAQAAAALTESGPGFMVGVSWGSVVFPYEVNSISEALAVADERMYANKRRGRTGALAQTKGALKRLIVECDPALAAHHERVADLAEQVARKMNLPDQMISHLRSAAELHDIGLLGIPDAIRNNREPLSEAERDFLHRHAVIGERILNEADSLHTAAAIVRASHERWDGHGYPAQMEGQDIPLAARIILACDAYDVMTHVQTYKEALTVDAARTELLKGADVQFDARVIAVLVELLDERAAEEASARDLTGA